MILYYVRHGDPIYKPDQLTPLGERQAEALAKRLSVYGVDEIYSSTSTRAMQTAQPTCELMKKELHTLEWMHESLASRELSLPVDENRKQWIWSNPRYSNILLSREVREMGDRWYEHPSLVDLDLGRAPK